MKKAIKGIAVLLVLIMTFTGCSYRGRTIREQIDSSQEHGTDASPSVISPSEGGYGSSGQMTVSLYFPYEEDNLLGREERVVDYSSSSRIEEVILQELIAGPSQDYPQLVRAMSEETQVVNLSLSGNCLFVTFNAAFLDPVGDVPENWEDDPQILSTVRAGRRLAVLSIVNSVTGVSDEISQVQILVDEDGTGLGRRIRRMDVGLSPTGENADELLETISRQYSANASLQNVAALVMQMMQDKNYERLYCYIADGYGNERPSYSEWIDTFRSADWSLESYEVAEMIPGYDGQTARIFVNARFNLSLNTTLEYQGVTMDMTCQSGVWKVDYESLRTLIPTR